LHTGIEELRGNHIRCDIKGEVTLLTLTIDNGDSLTKRVER
jgi:hypothetical protein